MTNFKEHRIFFNKINLELLSSSQNTLLVLFIFLLVILQPVENVLMIFEKL